MKLLKNLLEQSTRKTSSISIRRKQRPNLKKELNKIDLNDYSYVYDIYHQDMNRFKLKYSLGLVEKYNLDQYNYFGLPSTTFSHINVLDVSMPKNILRRYSFAEAEKGKIFERVNEIATIRYKALNCWNNLVSEILYKLEHDFYHFLDLDYESHFSTSITDLEHILTHRLLKTGGIISLTFCTRKDDLLLNFHREHPNYIEPLKGRLTKEAVVFTTNELIKYVGGGYRVLACEQFDTVGNIIIERIQ